MGSDLFFDNKRYIPAKEASSLTGYSKDYIGQLSRSKKIDSRRIGKAWYVSEESILKYKNSPAQIAQSLQKTPLISSSAVAGTAKTSESNSAVTSSSPEISSPLISPRIENDLAQPAKQASSAEKFPKYHQLIHKSLFLTDSGLSKGLASLALGLVLVVGLVSVGNSIIHFSDNSEKIAMSMGILKSHLSDMPKETEQSLSAITDFYASNLSAVYEASGQAIINQVSLLYKNPSQYLATSINSAEAFVGSSLGKTLAFAKNFLPDTKNRFSSYVSYSIGGTSYITSSVKDTTKNLTASVAESVSGKLNPVDHSAVAVYETFNNWFETGIYDPLASLFGNHSATNIYVAGNTNTGSTTNSTTNVAVSTSSAPAKVVAVSSGPVTKVVNTTNVVERIIQQAVPSGLSQDYVDQKLNELNNKIQSELSQLSFGSGGNITNVYNEIAGSQRIDQLTNTVINTPSITGGSITNVTITGGSITTGNPAGLGTTTVNNLIVQNISTSTFAGGIAVSGGCVSVNGTCLGTGGGGSGTPGGADTQIQFNDGGSFNGSSNFVFNSSTGNVGIGTTSPYQKLSVGGNVIANSFIATTSATSTFVGGIQTNLLNVTSTIATSTFANGIDLSGGCFSINGTCVTSGSTAGFPFTSVAGYNSTSTVIGLTGGFFSTASSTISGGFNLPALSNGGLAVYGGVVGSYATTTFGSGLTYSAGNVTLNLANPNTWTGLQTFNYSSTTYGSFTTSSSTFANVGTLTLPSLSAGFVGVGGSGSVYSFATSTIKTSQLTNDANFSVFPFTSNAGYNSTSTVLGLNGFFSTASSTISGAFNLPALSNGGLSVFGGLVSSGATTTAGTGLSYSGNAFNVNTTQNIAKLSNLTTNGFVKTSGGDGTLSVDTTSYQPAGTYLTSLGSGFSSTTASTITFSTSTLSFNGLTLGGTIIPGTGSLNFTPTVTGTLNNSGLTNSTISGVALGSNLFNLSATDNTLTFSGSYNGGSAQTIGLNLANPNTWTGLQTFNYSSTTYGSFTTSSSTFANVGTLTLPSLSAGFVGVGGSGSVYSFATSTIKTSQLTNDANFSVFPFTSNAGYNSTSTVLGLNGFFSTASSTISGAFNLPAVAVNSLLSTNASGVVTATSTPTFGNFIATSTSATSTVTYSLAVGTTSPWGQGLFTVGTSTPIFYVDRYTGFVGIGTTTPQAPLDISAPQGVSPLIKMTTGGKQVQWQWANYGPNNTWEGASLNVTRLRGTPSSPAAIVANDNIFNFNAVGYDGSSGFQAAYFNFDSDGTWTSSSHPGRIEFGTHGPDTAANATERMRIDSSGNVEISTTTGNYLLTLASSTKAQFALSAGAGLAQTVFRNDGTNFYISSTTVSGTATTSTSALEIALGGFGTTTIRGLNIIGQATSTSNVGFNITNGCFAISGNCLSLSNLTGTVSAISGGTGQTTYNTGDILYASAPNTLTRLAASTDGLVLKLNGGVPSWQTDLTTGGGGGSTAFSTTSDSLAIYPTNTANVFLLGTNATSTTGNIFEVLGNSLFRGNIKVTGNASSSLFSSNQAWFGGTATSSFDNAGVLTLGGVAINSLLSTNASGQVVATSTPTFGNFIATSTTLANYIAGSLGIGTSSPSATLAVNSVAGTNFSLWVGSTTAPWMTIANTGFGTTTVSGLNIAGSATTTSNVGFNITNGCFAIGGTCIGTGSAGLTALGSGWATTTASTITFSTSTLTFNGLTLGGTIIPGSGSLNFTPTVTGTLNNSGLTNSTVSGVALGSNLFNLSATDNTLTFSGSYNGGSAQTIGLNLANPNTWTGLQTFNYSSTTYGSFITASSTFANVGTLTLGNSVAINSLLSTNASGVVVATSTPTFGNFIATSTSATSTVTYSLAVGTTSPWGQGLFTVGTSSPLLYVDRSSGNVGVGTTLPTSALTVNKNGACAGAIYLDNNSDILNNIGSTITISGSGCPGSSFLDFRSSSSDLIRFFAGGGQTTDYWDLGILSNGTNHDLVLRRDAATTLIDAQYSKGVIGFSTTTPAANYVITIASSTAPQLSLSAGANLAQTVFRSDGTNFYISSTSVAGTATTSTSALEIALGGFGTTTIRGLNIVGQATSTSNVGYTITSGCYDINGTCVGLFPFTSVSGYNSTSTTLGLLNGFFSTASSTISGAFNLPAVAVNSLLSTNASGQVVATSTPTFGNFIATSTSVASVINYKLGIGTSTSGLSASVLTAASSNISGTIAAIENNNNLAFSALYLGNDINQSAASIYLMGSSGSGASGLFDGANSLDIVNNANAPLGLGTNQKIISTITGGGNFVVGSTTAAYQFTVASSTAPQLALSSGAGIAQWTLANLGGTFYLSTTTVAGTATTSTPTLQIDSSTGNIGIGTTTIDNYLTLSGSTISSTGLSGSTWTNRGLYIVPPQATTSVRLTANDFRAFEIAPYMFTLASSTLATTTYGSVFNPYTLSTTTATTVTTASTLALKGAPVASTSITIASSTALSIYGNSVANGGTVSSAYSLFVSPPTGATYNYAASLMGLVGIGTSSPSQIANLTIASSTAPQLSLSAGAGFAQFTLRNAGGNFYLSTTSVAGTSTSTLPAFSIDSATGNVGIATTAPTLASSARFTIQTYGNRVGLNIDNDGSSGAAVPYSGLSMTQGASTTRSLNLLYVDSTSISSGLIVPNEGIVYTDTGTTNGLVIYNQGLTPIKFGVGATEKVRVDSSGNLDVGTTTAQYINTIFSSTAPQLALSSGANLAQVTFRNDGTNFYISSTTVAGSATTSTSALEIALGGFGTTTVRGLNIVGQATSTSNVGFNISNGCYAIGGNCLSFSSLGGTIGISNGGTGSTSFAPNSIVVSDGTGSTLIATTSNYFTISSFIATSSVLNSYSLNNITAFGTSTANYLVTLASSTAPQLSLSAGANLAQVVFQNDGTNFNISTSTVAGNSLSSTPALQVSLGGFGTTTVRGLNIIGQATSTSNVGMAITSGCFSVNGTCIVSAAGSGSVNTGTQGQVAYYAAGGNTVSGTSNLFVDTTGFVGVGTVGPAGRLHVLAQSTDPAVLLIDQGASSNPWAIDFARSGFSDATVKLVGSFQLGWQASLNPYSDDNNNFTLGTISSRWHSLFVGTGSSQFDGAVTFNAGITANSSLTLGATAVNSLLSTDASGNIVATSTPTFGNFIATSTSLASVIYSKLGIGSTTPWAQLSVNPNALGSGVPEFAVGSSSTTHFMINGAGNVGIGTTSPNSVLTINGTQPGAVGTGNGTDALNALSIIAGVGGNTSDNLKAGGIGGAISLIAGTGGITSSATFATAGAGGVIRITGGPGGNESGGVSTNAGGAGGTVFISAGNGGSGTGGAAESGGNGGDLKINAGLGGTASGGIALNGTIGNIYLGDTVAGNVYLGSAGGDVGIGTTSSKYNLAIASTTGPQLSLSAGGGLAQFTFRNAGGSFYISTTTVLGNSTSTISALEIDGNSGTTTLRGLNIIGYATTTSNVGENISSGCFAISGNCLTLSYLGGVPFEFTSVAGYNSTSTTLGLLSGFFSTASSTQSGNFFLPSLTQGFTYTGSNGLVGTVSTSTIANYILPFTSYGASTSTIVGFTNGLFSTASSTFSNNLYLSNLTQGFSYIGSAGLVQTTSTSTLANYILPFTTYGASTSTTLGLLNGFFSTASSTISGAFNLPAVAVNSLLSTNASGQVVATSTPTFGNFIATSTVATSTVGTGGLAIGGSQFVVQQNSGFVGIGTVNPANILTLKNNSAGTNGISIQNYANTQQVASIIYEQTNDTWNFLNGSGGANSAITFGTNNGEKARIDVNGRLGIGTTTPQYLLTPYSATAPQLALSAGAGLAQWTFANEGGNFYVAPTTVAGTATSTSVLTILGSSSNVGIGTTSPAYRLDLQAASSNAVVERLYGQAGASSNNTQLRFAGQKDGELWAFGPDISNSNGGQGLEFYSLVSGQTGTKLIIQPSGNVGIGTTSPWRTLSVTGTVGFDGLTAGSGSSLCLSSNKELVTCSAGSASVTIGSAVTGGTAGSVLFVDGSGNLGQNNSNFFWNTANNTLGIGTTTPYYGLTIASTTGSQLALSAGANLAQVALRNDGTNFYISSTTVAGTATTSLPALQIALGGFGTTTIRGLNIVGQATTTSNVGYTITTGCYDINGTCIGSFPFTSAAGYNSTSTTLGFTGGLFSTASSTFSSSLFLPSLTQGFTYTGSNGLVGTVSTSTIANYILPFTSYGASTSTIIGFTNGFFSTASSTISGAFNLPAVAINSLLSTNASGVVVATSTPTFGNFIATSTTLASIVNYRLGIGTSSPYSTLSVSGNTVLDSSLIRFASSTATTLQIDYATLATSTIKDNTPFSWTIATSTTATPIFRIDTLSGNKATTSIVGGFSVDNGALNYDYSSGITSIDNLNLGSLNFGTDAGIVSWVDLPVATTTSGVTESYTAQLDGNPLLTLYGVSDGTGGVNSLGVGIGTTTPSYLLTVASSTAPQLSLSAGAGLAQWAFRNAGGNFYLATTTVSGNSTTSTSALNIIGSTGSVGVGTSSPSQALSVAGDLYVGGSGVNSTSTIERNLQVDQNLKIGTGSIYLNGNSTSTFTNGIQASYINLTGAAASSTFSQGISLTSGCFAIGTTCIGSGSSFTGAAGSVVTTDASGNLIATGTQLTVGNLLSTSTISNNIFLNNWTGFGTTTPKYLLTLASSTAPQLSLSDATGGDAQWTFRNAGGNLYLSTTTVAGTATTSISALSISGLNGSIIIATSTAGCLNVDATGLIYSATCAVGGGTFPFTSVAGYNSTSTTLGLLNGFFSTASSTISGAFNLPAVAVNSLLSTNASGVVTATSTPTFGNFIATSTSATSTISYSLAVGTTSPWGQGIFTVGTSSPLLYVDRSRGNVGVGTSTPWAQLSVTNNSTYPDFALGTPSATHLVVTSGGNVGIGNANPAYALDMSTSGNDEFISMAGAARSGLIFNNGSNSWNIQTSNFGSLTGSLLFEPTNNVNGSSVIVMTHNGYLGISTTTANYDLVIASSTAPQLSLSAGAGLAQTVFRNDGTNFYISSTTVSGTATTSTSALEIALGGFGTTTVRGLNIANAQATSTSNVGFSITSGCFAIGTTCIGSGSSFTGAAGSVVTTDASGNLIATGTQLTVGNILATSSATNIFGGALQSSSLFSSGNLSLGANGGATQWQINNGHLISLNDNTYDIGSPTGRVRSLYVGTNGTFGGMVGVGSTTPYGKLSIQANNGDTNLSLFNIGSSTASATTTLFNISNTGVITIATSTAGCLKNDATGLIYTGTCGGGSLSIGSNISGATSGSVLFADGSSNLAQNNSNFFWSTANTALGIGTTTPYYGLTVASTTGSQLALSAGANVAQFTFRNAGGNLYISTTTIAGNSTTTLPAITLIGSSGYVGIGSTSPTGPLGVNAGVTTNQTVIDAGGSINDFLQVNIQNKSTGTSAQSGFSATADNGTPTTNFAWMGINNSTFYNPQTFNVGGAGDVEFLGSGNDMFIANNNTTKSMYFLTGGTSTSTNTRLTITASGLIGAGTSTPTAISLLTIATSTTPQLSLSAGAGLAQWTFRNAGGNFYISTTTVSGNSTTTTTALSIIGSSGKVGIGTTTQDTFLEVQAGDSTSQIFDVDTFTGVSAVHVTSAGFTGIGTTTPWAQLSVNPLSSNNSAPAFAIGSSTATTFVVTNSGNVGVGKVNPSTLLDVNGTFAARSTSNAVFGDGSTGGLQIGDGTLTKSSGNLFAFNSGVSVGSGNVLINTATQAGAIQLGGGNTVAKISVDSAKDLAFYTQGNFSGESMRITSAGNVSIGTTTALYYLTVASTTAPQIALSAGGGLAQWTFANEGGNFYISTTTVAGTSTSTISALNINGSTGFVGIGTTTPWAFFSINPTSGVGTSPVFAIGSSTRTLFTVDAGGVATVGDISGTGDADFQFATDTDAWTIGFNSTNKSFNIASSTNFSSNVALTITKGASLNVGIGSTTPWKSFSVSGTVAFDGLTTNGAAQTSTLCLSSNKEVIADSSTCAVSSQRFKENINSLSADNALSEVMQLNPVSFYYKPSFNGDLQSDVNFSSEQLGFIAEDVAKIDPRLVVVETATTTFDGVDYPPGTPHTVRYEQMTALLAGAVQDINTNLLALASSTASTTPQTESFVQSFWSNLFARVTTWLADATNGIVKLFAKEVHTGELCVSDSTGSETCITKSQLDALIANAGSSSGIGTTSGTGTGTSSGSTSTGTSGGTTGSTSTTTPADTTSPVITIIGDNPATINIGTSYADLGATVTDTNADGTVNNNLGLHYNVDGVDMPEITIDTTAPATHTIIYSATDSAGNTGTATRTVNVVDPNASSTTTSTATTTSDTTATSTTP